MRPTPDRPPERPGTVVGRIGGEDSTIPAWYRIWNHEGALAFTTVVELDDNDRAAIATGANLMLTMFGAEVAWSVGTTPEGWEL